MKIEELYEYKIHNIEDNRARISVKVIENPNKIQFMNLLYDKRNRDSVVRGLVVNNNIYIWIAYDATHFTVKQFLIGQGVDGEFILFIFEVVTDPNADVKLFIYGKEGLGNVVQDLNATSGFKRMTRNLEIRNWN